MKDIFIVTSVIRTGQNPWSYFPLRSLFTEEQRFEQTLKTIESIRTYSPTSIILLVEASTTSSQNKQILKQSVDYFYDISEQRETIENCIESNCKGLGDAYIVQKGLEYIQQLNEYQQNQIQNIFKLSGRYCLNSKFHRDHISNSLPTFRKSVTILFSIPSSQFDMFLRQIQQTVEFMKTNNMTCIESYLPSLMSEVHYIDEVGVEGYIAIDPPHTILTK
jgi:hypothetical protein